MVFLKAVVKTSQRVSDEPCRLTIDLFEENFISICHSYSLQLITLLHKICYAYHQNVISSACTSILQGWNKRHEKMQQLPVWFVCNTVNPSAYIL